MGGEEEEGEDRVHVSGFVGDEEPRAAFGFVDGVGENGDTAGA